jgi:manganese transport protein
MGRFANGRLTRILATTSASLVLLLNAVLLYETFFGA